MKKCHFSVLIPILAILTGAASAETTLKTSGQIRVRCELDEKSFDTAFTTRTFALMRTRVGLEATIDSNAHAFVQFQDSRTLGGRDQFGKLQSGSLNDGKNVDLHQAYIQVDRIWFDGFGSKAGRFAFDLGNQRVFGSVDWHNVGRIWEGAIGWYESPGFTINGFWLKPQEENYEGFNGDFDVFGALVELDSAGVELFAFYEIDFDTAGSLFGEETSVTDPDDHVLDRWNFGIYYKKQIEPLDLELNGAFQTGQVINEATTYDLQAFMLTAEAGYAFAGSAKAQISAGVDFASGDDDSTDTKIKTYDNTYYTGHKFRGYMDNFVNSESAGLIDILGRARFNPHPNWTAGADFHYFRTAQNYRDPGTGQATFDVGMEIDITINTVSIAGVKATAGGSVFLPKESFVRFREGDADLTQADPTWWLYTQTTVNF
ncbi:MAG: alginate export family protein [Candidatus Zixiibacteriota bacterium]